MKSTKRYPFCKIGLLSIALIGAMLFSFCGKENTLYSYAYTKTTGVVKPESAKIRSEANTSSESVAGVKQSEKVTIIDETKDSAGNVWYKVEVDGKTGFIRADLVTKEAAAETTSNKAEGGETPKITETPADVTASSVTAGTVTEASINVRKGPSATDAVVTSAKKGTVVSVSGETKGADGKTWYQVSFLNNNKEVTGFVRSDLLDTSTQSAEETPAETPEGETGATPEETEGETQPPVAEQPENYQEISNVVGSKIIPEGTDISQMGIDESILAEWQTGNYYLLYTKGTDGKDSWYLYDISGGSYQEIENLAPSDAADEADSSGSVLGDKANIIIIILAILLVIMIILCTVMFLKMRQNKSYDDDDDDEEDDEDDEEEDDEPTRVKRSRWKSRNFLKAEAEEEEDDDEEEEEDEEDEEEEIPVKRPVKKAPIKKMPQSSKTQETPPAAKPTAKPVSKPVAKPIEKAVDEVPKFQMELDDDDDEFEFGFLNMESKDDL